MFRDLPPEKKKLATAIGLSLIAITLAAALAIPRWFSNTNSQRISEATTALAVSQVAVIDKRLTQLQSPLQRQLQNPEVLAALQQPDPAALVATAELLRERIPDALQLRLIPIGIDYTTTGLRFSQIDRLNRSERGETIHPEAFDDNGKKLFDLMMAIKDPTGKLLGHAVMVLDTQLLQAELAQVPVATAETLLQQQFGSTKAQTVFRLGSGTGLSQASKPADSGVPHWKVVVVPGPQLLADTAIPFFLLVAAEMVLVGACLGALFLLGRRLHVDHTEAHGDHATPIQIKGARKIDKNEFAQQSADELPLGDELADPLFQAGDVFDLDDDDLLEVRPATPKNRPISKKDDSERFAVPASVFRDYDIRGNADQYLSDTLAERIGQAFGSECLEQGQDTVVLAGDGRLSTPRLKEAVKQGLLASGCQVIDIGNVPTPLMYFATCTLDRARSGIMITASHNPSADNGFKMVINGHTLASDQIQRIRERVENSDFSTGNGTATERDILPDYIDHISNDIVLAGSYKVVVDCGNGIAGTVAPQLLEELGCDVVPLYCDVDGHFPHHAPDPSVMENLTALVTKVKEENADIGIAFDGDGDRLGVVTACGDIILPDRLLMLFAKDIVSRNPGADIIFDVKSTRRLNALISSHGGRPVMWKSGHSHIKNKMQETGALLGGELSGHIFFRERWFGFDDGMYSAARLLEIMSIRDQDLDSIFAAFPDAASTPEIRIAVPEDRKFSIIGQLTESGEWGNGKLTTIDGVRVDFAKGWGLVRASNTAAELTLRFEADDAETLGTVQHVFKQQLQLIDKNLRLPF